MPTDGGIAPDAAENPGESAEKRVTWAELFFDLVFVVAITQVSALIGRDHTWAGLLRALVVFVPIYWMWTGTAIQTNLLDSSRPLLRLRIFAVALAAIFMALSLRHAYGHLGLVFAVAYWSGRIVLCLALLRRTERGTGFRVLSPYTVSVFLTGPALVLGVLLHGGLRELVWGLAALIDLSTPTVLRTRLRSLHFDPAHLAERFGLFVLIALGESVVSVGTSTDGDLTAGQGFSITAAFVFSCGLWWVYFHFAADAVRHSLATARVQSDITRLVLSYGHLSFIAAIVVVAVGLRESIVDPGRSLSWPVAGLLFGGTAGYLATFGFTRWAMFRLVSYTRLITAAVVLVLLPLSPRQPALASLAELGVVLAALNAVELVRVEHIGWRALRGSTVR